MKLKKEIMAKICSFNKSCPSKKEVATRTNSKWTLKMIKAYKNGYWKTMKSETTSTATSSITLTTFAWTNWIKSSTTSKRSTSPKNRLRITSTNFATIKFASTTKMTLAISFGSTKVGLKTSLFIWSSKSLPLLSYKKPSLNWKWGKTKSGLYLMTHARLSHGCTNKGQFIWISSREMSWNAGTNSSWLIHLSRSRLCKTSLIRKRTKKN